ncbi:DUF1330 domain-containing protein [Prosthecodimorpha staleyi]|uniref:DUF1330 domain-containing protein n=1 Tax=Prosthecodimorpha staleyi TaxID=2840188 RepID=A0A947D9X4_9HYPH|nr:DUF1330 domain-containing protein [Prosthecodimorpha staleyi]MBT9292481.1 DUF1330 domain-containing protein [Prosthecodimorpha staleyi]
MAKAYWIARVDVTDPERYKAYVAANGPAFAKYNGRFLVRGGPFDNPIGSARDRNVVIEFDSLDEARACYASPEYAAAIAARGDGAVIDLIIIGGYDGPQPGA